MAGGRWHAGQSPAGGDLIGRNPTDCGEPGTKKSVLVERSGGPLGIVLAGANAHDTKLLARTIEAMVVPRPEPNEERPQHLCLDKGYDNPTSKAAVAKHHYVGHIRRIGEEKRAAAEAKASEAAGNQAEATRSPPRRWVVERTLAWLSKCRGILVRYDKERIEFPGSSPTRLRAALVSPP